MYASIKYTLLKKVYSLILYEDSTSIIQSTILERKVEVMLCVDNIPFWVSTRSQ